MSDGNIDYRGYSDPELGEALRAIDREKFPRNFENLQAALLERQGQDPVGVRRVMASDPHHATVRYSVRFTTTRIVGVPENSFGLTGGGSLDRAPGHRRDCGIRAAPGRGQ